MNLRREKMSKAQNLCRLLGAENVDRPDQRVLCDVQL